MDVRNLLVRCFTLLHKEASYMAVPQSIDLVKGLLDTIVNKDIPTDQDQFMLLLKGVLLDAIHSAEETGVFSITPETLTSEIRLSPYAKTPLFGIILDILNKEHDPRTAKAMVTATRHQLSKLFTDHRTLELLGSAFNKMKYHRSDIPDDEMDKWRSKLANELLLIGGGSRLDRSIMTTVDFANPEAVHACFNDVSELDGQHLLKTGMQGLNIALEKGLRLGQMVGVAAMKHRYKTGFTLGLFDGIAVNNTPPIRKEGKKPLMVHISAEDETVLNLKFLYEKAIAEQTGGPVNMRNVSSAEMGEVVHRRLTETGFSVRFLRIKPTEWSYRHFVAYLEQLDQEGYDVQVVTFDYMAKMPTTGFPATTSGGDFIALLESIYDYTSEKRILFITPFHLSPEAYGVLRNDVDEADFVKAVAGKGYYAISKKIGNVLDVEIYIHSFTKTERGGGKQGYLTIQIDKNKGFLIDPYTRYMIYPFCGSGPVLDDLNKEPTHMTTMKPNSGDVGFGAF